MISDQTRKVLIFSKLKGVGRVKLEEIIKIEGFDIKNPEDIVSSIIEQRIVKIDKDALINAEEIAENDIQKSKIDPFNTQSIERRKL